MEAQSPSATPPAADGNDPVTVDPLPGTAGNPGDGAAGLPGGSVTVDGAALGVGGPTAGALEELTTRRVPAGTRIRVTVDDEISTDRYRTGDAVIATVAEDVTDPSGEVLIPRGVKLLGRILTSVGSPGVDEPPVLEMTFETLSALNAEWPVEGAVINVPVEVDPRADIASPVPAQPLAGAAGARPDPGGGGRRGRVEGSRSRGSDGGSGGVSRGYGAWMGHAAPGGHAAEGGWATGLA